MLGSTSQCRDCESTGVSEAVEDQTFFGIVHKSLPIFTLIQIKAGFLALPDVHEEATRAFFNEQQFGRRFSPKGARAGLKTFLKSDLVVRDLVDYCRRKDLLMRKDD